MNTDEKNLFDALAEIKRAAFARIQERREGEWKLALAIWAGLAGLLALMLEKPEAANLLSHIAAWVLLFPGIVLLIFHFLFLSAVGQRHDSDRAEGLEAAKKMAELAGVTPPVEHPERGKALDWSRRVQLGISVLLFSLALVLWCDTPANKSLERGAPKSGAPFSLSR